MRSSLRRPPPPRPRPWPRHCAAVVAELEPECLGLYWPFRSEFNAAAALAADPRFADLPLALPFARRVPRAMEFRRWDGARADAGRRVRHRLAATAPSVVPDVRASCPASASPTPATGSATAAATTTAGWPRIPHVDRGRRRLVVRARSTPATFAAQPHDMPLTLIVTEQRRALAARRRRSPAAASAAGLDRGARRRRLGLDPGAELRHLRAARGSPARPASSRQNGLPMRPAAPNGSTSSPRCSASKTSGTRASATPWPASAACTCW